jgi:hypothetical protein
MQYGRTINAWLGLTNGIPLAVLLFLLWSSFAVVLHGQESASAADDHLAIAARYRQEAEEAREAIKRHQLSLDIYQKGSDDPYTGFNVQGRKRMVEHCQRLIAYYRDAARELEAMAQEHEALAQQPTAPRRTEDQQ